MATIKEYGLIFKDKSVKIAEVVIREDFGYFLAGISKDLDEELKLSLDEHDYHPIAIIPDTMLSTGDYRETVIRDATEKEEKQYLSDYENDWLGRFTCE